MEIIKMTPKETIKELLHTVGMKKVLEALIETLEDQLYEDLVEKKYLEDLMISLKSSLYQYEHRYKKID